MEGGTFEDRPAEWSWTALIPPAGPQTGVDAKTAGVREAGHERQRSPLDPVRPRL